MRSWSPRPAPTEFRRRPFRALRHAHLGRCLRSMLCQHGGHAAGSRPDGDHRRRDRRHQRGLSPVADGGHRRPGDRPGPAVRDRRFDVARARDHLPDQRLADDVPHRAGFGRPLRHARGGRRTVLVRRRRDRGGHHARAHGGAEASPGVRAVLRHRGHGAALADGSRRALTAAGPHHDPGRLLGAERRRGQGRPDRDGPGAEGRGRRRRVRGRRHRDRLRRPRGPGARGGDRSGSYRVRARPAVRRLLGANRRCPGGGAGPARGRPAPAGVDGPGARARRVRPATPGPASRWFAIRTCPCTSVSATITTAWGTTATSRS